MPEISAPAGANSEVAGLRDAPPEFYQRIRRLIAAHHPHLRNARLQVQVLDKAPQSPSGHLWAAVDTADNSVEASAFDFIMWFALDIWDALDERQRDALADHELCHAGWDEAGKPRLILHDIEEFNAVISRYGLWWPNAGGTLAALKKMPAPSEARRSN